MADVIELFVNGKARTYEGEPERPLLWYLRDGLGLTGTKYGCGIARCGACSVRVEGRLVRSCVLPMAALSGKRVVTIEGVAIAGKLHPAQAAWIEEDVAQCAHASGQEALALRLTLLGEPRELDYRQHGGPKFDTGRLAAVLRLVAKEIGWGRTLPSGEGLGLAAHFTFGGYAAHAFHVAVDATGTLSIRRVVCAVDVGIAVNPLGIRAQMEGGTIDGLSTALNLEITVREGRVVERNFDDYPLLGLRDAPRDIEVHIVASSAGPSGCGEMGIPTVAPALCNAIFNACGKRIRTLPIRDQLRRGLVA